MNAPELQALRRLLFFSAAEAARFLAADEERPQGVEERTWNRWEAGKMPVPDNIAATLRVALEYRERAIAAAAAIMCQATQAGDDLPTKLLWYAERDDWPEAPVLWRPHQSALAILLGESNEGSLRLVPFDARSFLEWRQREGVADTSSARAAWAAAVQQA
jgi:hypothetical protein